MPRYKVPTSSRVFPLRRRESGPKYSHRKLCPLCSPVTERLVSSRSGARVTVQTVRVRRQPYDYTRFHSRVGPVGPLSLVSFPCGSWGPGVLSPLVLPSVVSSDPHQSRQPSLLVLTVSTVPFRVKVLRRSPVGITFQSTLVRTPRPGT